MKKTLLIFAAVLLSGCSGLHVSWVATASYNATEAAAATPAPAVK